MELDGKVTYYDINNVCHKCDYLGMLPDGYFRLKLEDGSLVRVYDWEIEEFLPALDNDDSELFEEIKNKLDRIFNIKYPPGSSFR